MEIVTVQTKALAPIKARVTKMQTVVDALVIVDEPTKEKATNILHGIKSIAKDIDTKKKEITQPMLKALSATRALFAPLVQQYEEAERIVKGKMIDYYQEQEKIRLEAEEKLAARVEKGTLKVETAAKKLEEAPEVKTHVATDQGAAATIRKVKKFRVVDKSKLPMRFLLPDETAIRRWMNEGKGDLPGVEFYEEDSVSAR